VPRLIQMLYYAILPIPHRDKRAMESIFCGNEGSSNFRSIIAVKLTLLTTGPELGSEKIRVGRRSTPAVGYTVSKNDVGAWIYKVVVLGDGEDGRERWSP
jgi:hypothetical protein